LHDRKLNFVLGPEALETVEAAFGRKPKRRISSAAMTVISANCSAVGS
jgi:hypothetical protein